MPVTSWPYLNWRIRDATPLVSGIVSNTGLGWPERRLMNELKMDGDSVADGKRTDVADLLEWPGKKDK